MILPFDPPCGARLGNARLPSLPHLLPELSDAAKGHLAELGLAVCDAARSTPPEKPAK